MNLKSRRWIVKSTAIFLAIFLSVTASFSVIKADHPYYRIIGPGNTGRIEGQFNPDLQKQWAMDYQYDEMPVILGDQMFYITHNGTDYLRNKIVARNLNTGRVSWEYKSSGSNNICWPAIAGGYVIACDRDLLVINPDDGSIVSRYWGGGAGRFTQILPDGDIVYAFTEGTRVSKHNVKTGEVLWTNSFNHSGSGSLFYLLFEDKIFISNGSYFLYSAETGEFLWSKSHDGPDNKITLDAKNRRVYDADSGYNSVVDIDTGQQFWSNVREEPFFFEDKTISFYHYSHGFGSMKGLGFSIGEPNNGSQISGKEIYPSARSSNALMVDGFIYLVACDNRLLKIDTEGNLTSPTPLKLDETEEFEGSILIDDGRLITFNNYSKELSVYSNDKYSLRSPYVNNGTVFNQYLGQLHAHYRPDVVWWNDIVNGEIRPEFTVNKYRDQGYDFIALTEHNEVVPMPVSAGILEIENAEEDTQDFRGSHILAVGIYKPINETLSEQERINQIVDQDGIPIIAHPNSWVYPFSFLKLNQTTKYKLIEAYNNTVEKTYFSDGEAFSTVDGLLSSKIEKYLTASDDYTPGDGNFDGGAVVVNSESKTQFDILNNLRFGNFYALEGSRAPRISVNNNDKYITVAADRQATFKFIGKNGEELKTIKDVFSATYEVAGDEIYVRSEVSDGIRRTWSQPIFVDSIRFAKIVSGNGSSASLPRATLNISSTEETTVETVSIENYPEENPPAGYLSPVYSLSTLGNVLEGTNLSIIFKDLNLPVGVQNLSIYTYNEIDKLWQKVESSVNLANSTVSANLNHFSYYTLSAETPEDTISPTVSLLSPTDLNNLSGEVEFQASAGDNQAVTSVSFAIDNTSLGSDINGLNGFKTTTDLSNLVTGKHKLQLVTEDFSGNRTEKEYDIIIQNGITQPVVQIFTPIENQNLSGKSYISGNFQSQLTGKEVDVLLNDLYIEKIDLAPESTDYSKEIDWNQFKPGEYELKVEFVDIKNNTAETVTTITVGQNASAEIISPENRQYFQSEKINLNVVLNPADLQAEILIDNQPIANNSKINLIDYSLGEHLVTVACGGKGKEIARTTFTVTTDFDDLQKVVSDLYFSGEISYVGLYRSILSYLRAAKLYYQSGVIISGDRMLNNIVSSINLRSKATKPQISGYAKNIIFNAIAYIRK